MQKRGFAHFFLIMAIACLLVFLGTLFLVSRKWQTQTALATPVTRPQRIINRASPQASATLLTYQSSEVSLSYPIGWAVSQRQSLDGTIVTFSAKPLENPNHYPKYFIESAKFSDDAIAKREQGMRLFGFAGGRGSLAGLPAAKFAKTERLRLPLDPTKDTSVQIVVYGISYRGTYYSIGYEYLASAPNATTEAYFESLLKTLKLPANAPILD